MILTDVEVRVLGSLIEKEITTPEYYPLSLNALINACNQKTNREPVVSYNECTVSDALESLREKDLVIVISRDRVPKYDNYFADKLGLSPQENAVMDVLMLRGPQTPGEIRGRSERLYQFESVADVEAVLDSLAAREDGALVVKLHRQPGRKEFRYMHLLSGEPSAELMASGNLGESSELCAERDRLEQMENELTALRTELDELRQQFSDFKKQFE